jgi:hypothetical protein
LVEKDAGKTIKAKIDPYREEKIDAYREERSTGSRPPVFQIVASEI